MNNFQPYPPKAQECLDLNAARVRRHIDILGKDRLLYALRGKKILITGVTGLIGRNIFEALKGSDAEICGTFRNCQDFQPVGLSSVNLVEDNYDYIIHAAGYASPSIFTKYELETIELNTGYLESLIYKLSPGGTLLYLSSSEIYTGSGVEENDECQIGRTFPDSPRAAYIEGKKCGETICHAARRLGKIVKIARVSSAYGPGSKVGDTRVLNAFIQDGIRQKHVAVRGNPFVLRSFCYISDIVEMLLKIMFFGRQAVYNVGSEEILRVPKVAELVATTLGVSYSMAENIDHSISVGPSHIRISMRRYMEEFGNMPATPFKGGLKETIEWYQSLMDTANLAKAPLT